MNRRRQTVFGLLFSSLFVFGGCSAPNRALGEDPDRPQVRINGTIFEIDEDLSNVSVVKVDQINSYNQSKITSDQPGLRYAFGVQVTNATGHDIDHEARRSMNLDGRKIMVGDFFTFCAAEATPTDPWITMTFPDPTGGALGVEFRLEDLRPCS